MRPTVLNGWRAPYQSLPTLNKPSGASYAEALMMLPGAVVMMTQGHQLVWLAAVGTCSCCSRRHNSCAHAQEHHADLAAGAEVEGVARVAVAGRVMNKRVMGKLAFLTLRDDRGQIQV
jgi:hypothetical protein